MATKRMEALDKMEEEAKRNARKKIEAMLMRPDQLEKLEQYRRRHQKKKATLEAHLKTAVQSQMEGIKTGLNQLQDCLTDIRSVQTNMKEVVTSFHSIEGLREKLVDLSAENTTHSKLSAHVQSINLVSNIPEMVQKTQELIGNGKLLQAHKHLSELESSRDTLMLEAHKQECDPRELKRLEEYFSEVAKLSENLGKRLWMDLQRTLVTIRREPTVIVTALRIIEREERNDDAWEKKRDATKFRPQGRPKKWRIKCFNVLSDAVETKLEGCQLEERDENRLWLVRHLEVIRRNTIDDLKVIKSLCEPCFPPNYDIVNRYVKLYHTAISQHLLKLKLNGLVGNEVVSMLMWIAAYYGPELMGHPGLEIKEGELGPLLSPDDITEFQNTYLATIRKEIQEYMTKNLESDKSDWMRDTEPDKSGGGFAFTQLPVILFQILDQNFAVARIIGDEVVVQVVDLSLEELSQFANLYQTELKQYKDIHRPSNAVDPPFPPYYVGYVIANINNCLILNDLMVKMEDQYKDAQMTYGLSDPSRYKAVSAQFTAVAEQCCIYLKEEVFQDIQKFVQEIFTRDWLISSGSVDTICLTIDDYSHDFELIKPPYAQRIVAMIFDQLLILYIRQMVSPSRKVSFKNCEERKAAGRKIVNESGQIMSLYAKLMSPEEPSVEQRNILPDLAEIIKMEDTFVMELELSNLYKKYPDINSDHLSNLLLLREDVNKAQAKQFTEVGLGKDVPVSWRKGIMSQV